MLPSTYHNPSPAVLAPHWDLYPAHYVAQRAGPPSPDHNAPSIPIDGDLSKEAWRDVPWSAAFGDIQGADAPADALRPAQTQFKALYDDHFLYIAALLHPAPDLPTQAHFTQRNDPIFQKDSDFEVFVDLAGCNHDYKELEINAINTVWNLMLDKPYEDRGHEHSGRIAEPGDPDYYEVYHQRTAARVLEGTLNDRDRSGQGALWSVELALAFSDLRVPAPAVAKKDSQEEENEENQSVDSVVLFRINFSRVEREGYINWTWQPQGRWDPANRRFAGFVNMHYPDAWGYVQLGGTAIVRDPQWPARLTAMTVYYALHYHKEQTGAYTTDLDELVLPREIVDPFDIAIELTTEDGGGGGGFVVTAQQRDSHETSTTTSISVRDDRLLTVNRRKPPNAAPET